MQKIMNKEGAPELSVIVPVYNTEIYLRESLDSILSQDYRDLEVIAVDDGSTDRSGKILEEYKSKDHRIHVFHRCNAGLSATRNFGLKQAKGKYIYFFDSDDRLVQGALRPLLQLLKKTDSDLIGFSGRYIDQHGKKTTRRKAFMKLEVPEPVKGEQVLVDMINSGSYSPIVSMYIYNHSFLREHSLSFTEGYIHEDEFFTIRALCLANKVVSDSRIFFEHRIREGSIMSNAYSEESAEGWAMAVSQILDFIRSNTIQPSTRKVIIQRARQLAHNTVKIINRKELSDISVFNLYNKAELNELGFPVRLRSKSPFLFKVYIKFRKLISTK